MDFFSVLLGIPITMLLYGYLINDLLSLFHLHAILFLFFFLVNNSTPQCLIQRHPCHHLKDIPAQYTQHKLDVPFVVSKEIDDNHCKMHPFAPSSPPWSSAPLLVCVKEKEM